MADLIKIAEEAFATGKQVPAFKAGDTVTVAYRIVEGNKERVQLYRGVVIKISGHGDKKRFTVRKMSGTVGVERIFPIESPVISRVRRHASRKSVPPSRRRHKQPTKQWTATPCCRPRLLSKLATAQLTTPFKDRNFNGSCLFCCPLQAQFARNVVTLNAS